MKINRFFGIQLSGSRNECDSCSRLKRYRFRGKSISLRFNDNKCYCLYKKYFFLGIPIIHTKEVFSNLEKAEDAYLVSFNERFNKVPGR